MIVALENLTVAMTSGVPRSLLIISQDCAHHEASPLVDGLFTQRGNISVEIFFFFGAMRTKGSVSRERV